MTTQVIHDPFHLTNTDNNITEADGTANIFSDIWKYQCPIGVTHVLRAGQTFSLYLEDSSSEVGNQTCRVQIEVRDPAEQDTLIVYGPALYIVSKEFRDATLKARIGTSSDILVPERYWIVVMARDDGAIDASDSYFDLYIARQRAKVI